MCVSKKLSIISVVLTVFCLWSSSLTAKLSPPKGLAGTGNQLWNQDSSGILGVGETGDNFGKALATGDFNGDGRADLAVGAPDEMVNGENKAGAVNVIYGSSLGLRSTGNDLWTQDSTGIDNAAEENDCFGQALAAGDFNNDGYDDLVIGVPGEALNGKDYAGALHVLPGTISGLTATGEQFLHQNISGMHDSIEEGDSFAWSLTTGYFNGDNYADLAIGVISEDIGGKTNAGIVHVVYGSAGGLNATKSQIWHQGITGIPNKLEENDRFGMALTSGDFDSDGFDDLAIGVPQEDSASQVNVGTVHVIYGSNSGLTAANDDIWWHSTFPPNAVVANDSFGNSLSGGDFNNDGYDDLAIGIRRKDVSGEGSAGAAQIIYGTSHGLASANSQYWHQNSPGIDDACNAGDHFAYSLVAGNFDGDGSDDLAFGVPYEDTPSIANGGMVYEMHGVTGSGLAASDDDQSWTQSLADIIGSISVNDYFGQALAAGDFNNDGADDLAIGIPNDKIDGKHIGSVQVLYGVPSSWDAGYTDVGSGWRQLPWLDYYAPLHNDWYNHNEHGFIYVAPASKSGSVYIYTLDMGWLWTSSTQYPYLYRFSDNSWLWYLKGSDNPRWFKNLTSDTWENVTD